jgi:hypothetical protein
MIEEFVSGISTKMGINLSRITLIHGESLGCHDAHLLNISSEGHVVSALVFQADIENLKNGCGCDSLEVRMRTALSRLQMLIDPR